jgi:Alw26I/Eco31I/Esp3I family type II restriction m6 adenine DNA methyltransferase
MSQLSLFPYVSKLHSTDEYKIRHFEIASENLGNSPKDLRTTSTGKFYTPERIGRTLAAELAKKIRKSPRGVINIIDPFCGDGRLIIWLLDEIKDVDKKLNIFLWDYDAEAVDIAFKNIQEYKGGKFLIKQVEKKKTNSFSEFHRANHEGKYDVIITNPPWDVLKPDPKELMHLSPDTRKEYVNSLKNFSEELSRNFPTSRPISSYGGWGCNLGRIGTELSVRLAATSGVVGIVTQASLWGDQSSLPLREWIFKSNNCNLINFYPAELRLFSGVDQAVTSLLINQGQAQGDLQINQHSSKTILNRITKLELTKSLIEELNYTIPISINLNNEQLKILRYLRGDQFLSLENLEKNGTIWLGRELDETGYKTWTKKDGDILFVKGRMIARYETNAKEESIYLSDEKKATLPNSVAYERIVWRDVARASQKRRIIASLIPPKSITGNSLGVAFVKQADRKLLLCLLGVISSFAFEFQLRSLLSTGHISATALRKVSLPPLDRIKIEELASLVEKRMNGDIKVESEIEVIIAKHYFLSKAQFALVLDAFEKLSNDEKKELLNQKAWK